MTSKKPFPQGEWWRGDHSPKGNGFWDTIYGSAWLIFAPPEAHFELSSDVCWLTSAHPSTRCDPPGSWTLLE